MRVHGNIYLLLICFTAGLGGFLFGFDTAVISGAVNMLRKQFELSPMMEGWVMSSALIGCVAGAAVAGYLADRYGRKRVLYLSALLFILSSIGCAYAQTVPVLIVARIVGGAGVGFAAMVAPMFISEIAPAKHRGRLVSLYQLAITLGILVSYLSNGWLLRYSVDFVSGNGNSVFGDVIFAEVWRAMLGSNTIPSVLFLLLLFFIPESPRWLLKEKRSQEAEDILTRISGADDAKLEMVEIRNSFSPDDGKFSQLFERGFRLALIIGIVLPFLTQLAGITTVMYYAPAIFENAGFGATSAMGSASIIGVFNTLFTIIAIWKIDKWGRKPLLLIGFAGLALALALIGFQFYRNENANSALLYYFVLYIAVFAATLGPGVWVVISEIYPTRIRGRAMSLATLSLFLGSTFVTQTYPVFRESVGVGPTFWIYAAMMVPAIYFVSRCIPETKGKTLEEIEKYWTSVKK